MTITYTSRVTNCGKYGCFLKMLARWKGSVYKLVWVHLLMFLAAYYSLYFMYTFALPEQHQRSFEHVVEYCSNSATDLPTTFVLGFYVTEVIKRWWRHYKTIPWPDSLAVLVSTSLHGHDDRARVMRRTVMRYVNLCLTMIFVMISPPVRRRFPTMSHLVNVGLLEENERIIIQQMSFPNYPKHWLPIVWAAEILQRARKEGRIYDTALNMIIKELNIFRGNASFLLSLDLACLPLVYTQAVVLALYSYFLSKLIGTQITERSKEKSSVVDLYFPIANVIYFIFYMGWYKVGESLLNPFGDDDDDFELNWMIDRNLQVCYFIVDSMHDYHPQLVRDQYWDQGVPAELPYANEDGKRDTIPQPSTGPLNNFTDLQQRTSLKSVLIDTAPLAETNSDDSLLWMGAEYSPSWESSSHQFTSIKSGSQDTLILKQEQEKVANYLAVTEHSDYDQSCKLQSDDFQRLKQERRRQQNEKFVRNVLNSLELNIRSRQDSIQQNSPMTNEKENQRKDSFERGN